MGYKLNFFYWRVSVLSLIVCKCIIGLAQLADTLLLFLADFLIGHAEAFLPDGIEGLLDMHQMLGSPL